MSAGNPRSPTGSPFARSLPQHTHHSRRSTAKHIASSARAVALSEHNAGGGFCELGAAVAIRTGSWHRHCSRATAPRSDCRAGRRDKVVGHRRARGAARRPARRRATSVMVGAVWLRLADDSALPAVRQILARRHRHPRSFAAGVELAAMMRRSEPTPTSPTRTEFPALS